MSQRSAVSEFFMMTLFTLIHRRLSQIVKVSRFPSCCVKNPPPFSSSNAFLVSVLLLCTLVLHVCFVFTKAHCARHSLLEACVLVKQSRPTEQTNNTESQSMWTHQICTALRSVCLGISLSKTCFNINGTFFFKNITSLRHITGWSCLSAQLEGEHRTNNLKRGNFTT